IETLSATLQRPEEDVNNEGDPSNARKLIEASIQDEKEAEETYSKPGGGGLRLREDPLPSGWLIFPLQIRGRRDER
ncbi:hypothetical protein AKJ65_08310, partial [candidate division MSBL1 archaeon SCGC-AAA259E19]